MTQQPITYNWFYFRTTYLHKQPVFTTDKQCDGASAALSQHFWNLHLPAPQAYRIAKDIFWASTPWILAPLPADCAGSEALSQQLKKHNCADNQCPKWCLTLPVWKSSLISPEIYSNSTSFHGHVFFSFFFLEITCSDIGPCQKKINSSVWIRSCRRPLTQSPLSSLRAC